MEWLVNLFTGSGVAHSVFILALVIAGGLCLNKIKFGSVSLGVTWILFVGIVAGHFGFLLDSTTAHFVKEFGLILFIYSIGLEVGPGFFSSFRKGGITLNMLAVGSVLLACCTAYVIHLITGTSLVDMVGVLSGAVTNTPGMGAAQQTFFDMTGQTNTSIAQGYAVTYPLGVVGVILTIILLKHIFRVNFDNERRIMLERRATRCCHPRSTEQFRMWTHHPRDSRTLWTQVRGYPRTPQKYSRHRIGRVDHDIGYGRQTLPRGHSPRSRGPHAPHRSTY